MRRDAEGNGVVTSPEPSEGSIRSSRLPIWLAPVLVGVASSGILHVGLALFRSMAPAGLLPDGFRVQDWSSNWLMQTLGLEEMIPFGLKALWYSHVYPPLEDAIRFAFTLPETSAGLPVSATSVDARLYLLYTLLYGAVNALLYVWVRSLTRHGWIALGVTIAWAVHPGYLTVMTLLDPSPLAMLGISLSLFFLYMFCRFRDMKWSTAFFAALLFASLSRSVTQVQFLAVIFVALVAFWFLARRRSLWLLALNVLLVALMCLLPLKMKLLYETWDVTTYGGYHRVGMLWIDPRTVPQPVPDSVMVQYEALQTMRAGVEDPTQLVQMTPAQRQEAQAAVSAAEQAWQQVAAKYPGVDFATARTYPDRIEQNALQFSSRFNTREQVLDNYRLSAAANTFLVQHPLEAIPRLWRSVGITVPEALRPASEYTQNYFVEKLPWRAAWDWLFSGWRYLLLIGASAVIIMVSRGWAGTRRLLVRYGWFIAFYALLALPILFSNRFRPGQEDEGPIWTDAMRQKVFLELPVWALGGYALWLVATQAGRGSWRRKGTATPAVENTSSKAPVGDPA